MKKTISLLFAVALVAACSDNNTAQQSANDAMNKTANVEKNVETATTYANTDLSEIAGTYSSRYATASIEAYLEFNFKPDGTFSHERERFSPDPAKTTAEGTYEVEENFIIATFSTDRDLELIPMQDAKFEIQSDGSIKTGEIVLRK